MLSVGCCAISGLGWAQIHGGEKALVFQEVTSGQVRPDHTTAPSPLELEAGAYEGLVPCSSLVRGAPTLPTAPRNSGYILGVFAGCIEVEKCC